MSRLSNLLIGLTTVTGLYVLFSESWNGLYRWNLVLHPLIGGITTIALVWYAASHIGDKLGGEGKVSPWRVALILGLPAVGVTLGHGMGNLRWLPMIVVAAVLVGPLRQIGRFVMKRLRHAPAVLLGGTALGLWAAALATGIPLFALDGEPVANSAIYSHRTLALIASGVYVVHLAFIRVYRADRTPGPKADAATADLSSAIRIMTACCVGFVALLAVEAFLPARSFDTLAFRLVGDGHPAVAEDPLTGVDHRAFEVNDSCALSGCHEGIVDDYQHSTHRLSPKTPYMQRVLELLASEEGEMGPLVCASCHFPNALMTDNHDFRAYETEDGFTCMSCHGITQVGLDIDPDEPRKSSFRIDAPLGHLRMFVDDAGEEKIDGFDLHMIRMNPLGHGRALNPPIVDEQELCLACHHNEIEPPETGGFQRPECRDCHMQPRFMLNRPGDERNHVIPGANTAVPAALGREESLAITRGFLSNEFKLYSDKWGSAWELRQRGRGHDEHRAIYLRMKTEIEGDPQPGNEVTLLVRTGNVGIEHHFPAAPLDLIDVWLQVEVRDATDRVIFEHGALDDTLRVPNDAHRMGGHVLDEHGERLAHHRIWRDSTDVHERRILPGLEEDEARYAFRFPDDVAFPLAIRARWNYRKITQDFVEWAYGRDDVTMPVTVVEEDSSTFNPPRAQSARTNGPDASPAG